MTYFNEESTVILNSDDEVALFSRLNKLRKLEKKLVDDEALRKNKIKKDEIFNKIVMANVRLVINIAYRFRAELDPDDLFSDGITILYKCIRSFDVTRGFKFSTYASNAVYRHFNKLRRNKRESFNLSFNEDFVCGKDTEDVSKLIETEELKSILFKNLKYLSEKERNVLEQRFGLNQEQKSLREIANQYNFSKERARQITEQSLEKLRRIFRRDYKMRW